MNDPTTRHLTRTKVDLEFAPEGFWDDFDIATYASAEDVPLTAAYAALTAEPATICVFVLPA